MADETSSPRVNSPKTRPMGGTEFSWYRSVPGGTGITVLALHLSKPPNLSTLQNTLHKLQNSHPILRSKLTHPSFSISPTPSLQIQSFNLSFTSNLLQNLSNPLHIPPLHLLLEHELNQNPWSSEPNSYVFFVTLYAVSDSDSVLALRLHTSVCDRTSGAYILRELMGLITEEEGGVERECENEICLAIEDLIPKGSCDKPFWARGFDLVGYSLNSLRTVNLGFEDVDSPRSSQVVRLKMRADETDRLLTACKARGIKLCGAIAAAGLIAANSSKHLTDDQSENYAVVTLIDCRRNLDPVLHDHQLGFYHSAILSTQTITNGEELWDVASRSYTAFSNAMNSNKHFKDMNDLNFLMCKAIENPALTPSSSMRTAFISVFEDPMIDDSSEVHREVGLEDYMGCSSVHGVGPSIAIFDTIRNGQLDCACVYPSPLHSRKQIQELIDDMEKILVEASK
ncbi:uncharacterized protein LOC143863899 [Tasmannia lanceolata]|uniref:uncharacterized protein LOC143863899 n=1 Tax=Tasmannia lanceolata TaxID=3420 RepID=UPI004062B75B